jgi:hypothetical protein
MLFDSWLLVRWMAQSLVLGALILVADLVAGSAVIRLLDLRGRARLPGALRAAAAVALGAGLAGLALLWLGLAGRLTPAAPLAVTGAFSAAGAAVLTWLGAWRQTFSFAGALLPPRRQRRVALLLVALVALPCGLLVVDLMAPVLEFDSTTYHMTAARLYRETGAVGYFGALRYNAHPQLSVLLLLRHWSILGDDALAKLVNLEYGFMILLCLVYAARELGWKAGWIPGALFVLSSPLVAWVAELEYADLPLAAYFTVGGCLLFHQLRRRAETTVLAGLVLGLAASIKLQGHVIAACLGAGFAAVTMAGRRDLWPAARRLALVGLLIALVCGGWWLRSWIHTGSPAYPFFVRNHPEVGAILRQDGTYGRGHDLGAFLKIPWHMLVGPPEAFADPFVFGPAGLLLLAAGAAAAVRTRRGPPREIVFLLCSLAPYLLFWFFTSQVMRYLVSLLPLAAVLFLWLLVRAGAARRVPLAAALVLAVLPFNSVRLASRVFRTPILPVVTRAERQQALAAVLPYYYAVREVNRLAQPGDRTYLMFCEDCKYYTRTPGWGDWYGERNYAWLQEGTASAADVVARLKAAGFRWVVVSRDRARRAASVFGWDFAHSAFVDPEIDLAGAKTVVSDRGFAVFQLW